MAKRFTDTDKWKREWFYDLDPKAKLVWIFLLDQCDHCGIWPRNFKILSDLVAFRVDEQMFSDWFKSKIILFDSDKYFIPSFFEFQYGNSKEGFKAKLSALNILVKLNLMNPDGSVRNTKEHFDTLPNTSEQSMDCPSIGIGIGIGIGIPKGGSGGKKELPELANLWNQHCGSLSKVIGTNKSRNKKISERLNEAPLESWVPVIERIAASAFCNGSNGWKADFDFLIQPETRLKVLEGKYDDRVPKNKNQINQGYQHDQSEDETRKALGL